jgi:hypothetical protein
MMRKEFNIDENRTFLMGTRWVVPERTSWVQSTLVLPHAWSGPDTIPFRARQTLVAFASQE